MSDCTSESRLQLTSIVVDIRLDPRCSVCFRHDGVAETAGEPGADPASVWIRHVIGPKKHVQLSCFALFFRLIPSVRLRHRQHGLVSLVIVCY